MIPLEEALRKAFHSGLRLGIELGGLCGDIAPRVSGRSEKKISALLKKEIDILFGGRKAGEASR